MQILACCSLMGFAGITLLMACRHPAGQPGDASYARVASGEEAKHDAQALTSGEERTSAEAAALDPQMPFLLPSYRSPIAKHWKEGASSLNIRVQSRGSCEGQNLAAETCIDEVEWQISRSERGVSRLSCRCGNLRKEQQVLAAQDFEAIDARIMELTLATSPAPCAHEAPEVKVEIVLHSGEKLSFPVNYGQCGQSFAPRIELASFEALNESLIQIKF